MGVPKRSAVGTGRGLFPAGPGTSAAQVGAVGEPTEALMLVRETLDPTGGEKGTSWRALLAGSLAGGIQQPGKEAEPSDGQGSGKKLCV